MEEVVDILFEVDGDLVQGGEGRRSFVGLEEGDEFDGGDITLCWGAVNKSSRRRTGG